MTDALEDTAQKIAAQGREALLARLRPAFAEAATSHADIIELDPEQLEQIVQRAADRADGLQWRRALAAVATDQLAIGLGEALGHPAVARAQEILGAPSYEDSLAQLSSSRHRAPGAENDEAAPDERAASEEREAADSNEPKTATAAAEPRAAEPDGTRSEFADPNAPAPVAGAPPALRLDAVHLGGIANLAPAEGDLELRLSEEGLDIVRGVDESLGRLTWPEVRALYVPPVRGLRRRRQRAHLVIRTEHGDASFEIPELAPQQLRERISPWSARSG